MARWSEFIQRFDLEILYIKGENNCVADALSRHAIATLPAGDVDDWPDYMPDFLCGGQVQDDIQKKLEHERDNFTYEGEVLYRKENNQLIPYVPYVYRVDVVDKYNERIPFYGWLTS